MAIDVILVILGLVWIYFFYSAVRPSSEEYRIAGYRKGWWVFWSVAFPWIFALFIPLYMFFRHVRPAIRSISESGTSFRPAGKTITFNSEKGEL